MDIISVYAVSSSSYNVNNISFQDQLAKHMQTKFQNQNNFWFSLSF